MQVLNKHVREGGGSEGNAYFAYVVRGGGGSRGKMLILARACGVPSVGVRAVDCWQ